MITKIFITYRDNLIVEQINFLNAAIEQFNKDYLKVNNLTINHQNNKTMLDTEFFNVTYFDVKRLKLLLQSSLIYCEPTLEIDSIYIQQLEKIF